MRKYQINNSTKVAAGQLRADLQQFFLEKFTGDTEQVEYTPAELQEALTERFGNDYHVKDLVQLLANGFQQANGIYIFKKSSFELEHAAVEEARRATI